MTLEASSPPTRNFLICGLARNCEKLLEADVKRIERAFEDHGAVRWLVVESDSTDRTLAILNRLKSSKENFEYLSLGILQETLPLRTERIAYCRNAYLDQLFQSNLYDDIDFAIVCDMDGLNSELNSEAVASCWRRKDWDVCTANQRGPYYDIFALRHPIWCPGDCWRQFEFLQSFRTNKFKNHYASVLSLMVPIPPQSEWIKVDSAFGGLAIYRKEALRGLSYQGTTPDGSEICEHVTLNQNISSQGKRIFINPQLVNASYTEHTATFKPHRRLRRNLKAFLKNPVRSLLS